MKILALVLSVALAVKTEDSFITIKDLIAQSPRQGSRIIAGQPAEPAQLPWQVAIYYRRPSGGLFFCGGSLISDRFVLTAAHCAAESSQFSLFFGGNRLNSNEQGTLTIDIPAQAAIIHPLYNSNNLNNDIALIELPEPILFSDRISSIRLPQEGEVLQVGSELSVSGWGVTETSSSVVSDLLFTNVRAISNLQCAAVYGSSVIIDSTVCTQGNPVQSPCNGDSGGPLVSYDGPEPTLVGVVSFVHRDGCSSGQPAGYVRVEAQLQFVNEVLSQSPENPEQQPPKNPEEPPPENPEQPPPPENPEQPPPENPEEPPPPENPEQPPPLENPEEPSPPQNPEQPPPENPEQKPPSENPEVPLQPPENPEEPPPENPEEPPPPENPEQPPPPENPEEPPPPENPEQPPPPENPEEPPPPENPEQSPPENPEKPPPPENPEQPPPPENPEEPPPPENPEQPPSENPEKPPPEDPIPDYIRFKLI